MAKKPNPIKQAAEVEGVKTGIPAYPNPNNKGLKHLLTALPSTEKTVGNKGLDGFDPKLASRVIAALSAAVIEQGLAAGDDEVPMYKRVDWAIKAAPMINQLASYAKDEKGDLFPLTTEAVESELTKRMKAIAALDKGLKSPDPAIVDKVLDTFQPVPMEASE